MKRARLLFGGSLSPKLQAASAALDESIRRKDPTIASIERAKWVDHLVRLYQTSPEMSRQSLYEFNQRDKHGYIPMLGHDVLDRLVELGIVAKKPSTISQPTNTRGPQ
ncbi:hypothetical protein D3C87_1288870 [compost metagenome]